MNFVTGKISASALTGISNPQENPDFIYPNPSNGLIHFQGKRYQSEIKIFDISGKLVVNQFHPTEIPFDATNLPDGFYFLQLSDGVKQEIYRWIKASK